MKIYRTYDEADHILLEDALKEKRRLRFKEDAREKRRSVVGWNDYNKGYRQGFKDCKKEVASVFKEVAFEIFNEVFDKVVNDVPYSDSRKYVDRVIERLKDKGYEVD